MPFRDKLLALTVVCLWAFNMIVIKLGVAEIPPLLTTALRFTLVSLLLVPFTRITRRQLPGVLLVSFTFGTIHFGLLFTALEHAEAGTSAVVLQLGAPIATVLACLLLREPLGLTRSAGLAISVAGILVLAIGPTLPPASALVLLLISATGWAVTNLIVKQVEGIRPMAMMGWSSLFSVPQLLLASWILEADHWGMVATAGWNGWFSVVYSAVGSSIIGYGIWYWLLQRHSINAVVPYSMLNPLLTVLFGIVLIGDDPSPVKMIGALIMVVGVALILRKPTPTLPDAAE
ncbi:DMT family transporter [Ancylobacter defluvii]|uniref:Integral membrane protein n=1 Tax=Ancylobacter defluvii TaxID=1282440 RepID=A0A9W6NBB5_9HYPH|nr:EamA family transporter [Ancylobacter defluvii]MBS7588937.1 EamA family transporter [Ancylobacter defluvii]GLK84538.1 integral membrane protein [Ancylobacter defluvii]